MKIIANKQVNHLHIVLLSVSAIALAVVTLFVSTQNTTAGPDSLLSNKQVTKTKCDVSGSPVINVAQKVVKTVDSGEGGNYWAFDDFNRKIQVWKNTDNTFCALVDYEGKFDSQAGQQSPGNTGLLTGSEDGNFKGGYRAKVTGALKTNPDLNTKGSIGTTNYNCDIGGNCPGAFSWLDKYFGPGYIFSYEWWGWEYKYKTNVWINSSDGNSGDIL